MAGLRDKSLPTALTSPLLLDPRHPSPKSLFPPQNKAEKSQTFQVLFTKDPGGKVIKRWDRESATSSAKGTVQLGRGMFGQIKCFMHQALKRGTEDLAGRSVSAVCVADSDHGTYQYHILWPWKRGQCLRNVENGESWNANV